MIDLWILMLSQFGELKIVYISLFSRNLASFVVNQLIFLGYLRNKYRQKQIGFDQRKLTRGAFLGISICMNENRKKIGRWYVGFGIFLILCGLAGYASNPAAAKTALISGTTFGTLSALWGFWMLKGGRLLALLAAGLTTLMLCGAFTWRSIVSWQAYSDGEPKLFAAALITAMLFASVASLVQLLRTSKSLLAKN